jgi:predicted Zn-dependent peptidase
MILNKHNSKYNDIARKHDLSKAADNGFFTSVLGTGFPIGSFYEPSAKAGLIGLAAKMYKYGTKNYSDIVDLYQKIENVGSQLFLNTQRDIVSLGLQGPQDKASEFKDVIREIVENVEFKKKDLQKAKASQLMEINDLMSQDYEYAQIKLSNKILGDNLPLGTSQSLKNITMQDVREVHNLLMKKVNFGMAESADVWESDYGYEYYQDGSRSRKIVSDLYKKLNIPKSDIPVTFRSNKIVRTDHIEDGASPIEFIDRELPQKVICLGVKTKSIQDYPPFLTSVANRILYNGLVGLIPEIIRGKHSAAYYAYSMHRMWSFGGMLYVVCGVSEKNVLKALQLCKKILERVAEGDFEKDYVDTGKEKTKMLVEQCLDDPKCIFNFYLKRTLRGVKIYKYNEIIQMIDDISKKDIVEFFDSIIKDSAHRCVINGELNTKLKNKCKKIFK